MFRDIISCFLNGLLVSIIYIIALSFSPTLQAINFHIANVTLPTLFHAIYCVHYHVPHSDSIVVQQPQPFAPHWATVYLDELDTHVSQPEFLHFQVPAWTIQHDISYLEAQTPLASSIVPVSLAFATALLLALAVPLLLTEKNLFRVLDLLFDATAPIPQKAASSVEHTPIVDDDEVIELIRDDDQPLDIVIQYFIIHDPVLLAALFPLPLPLPAPVPIPAPEPLLIAAPAPAPIPAAAPAPIPAPVHNTPRRQPNTPAKARSHKENWHVQARPTQRAKGTRVVSGGVMLGIRREPCPCCMWGEVKAPGPGVFTSSRSAQAGGVEGDESVGPTLMSLYPCSDSLSASTLGAGGGVAVDKLDAADYLSLSLSQELYIFLSIFLHISGSNKIACSVRILAREEE
ncbi:hypothetical protein FB45DRAFT_870873 [Roridomyces roridus]|uniref:Uncharacterized protein n=1 Tax=Roridomyces roridus TaxID=1738132 RepID=A0AAD7FIQ3_9AGAR|nr:hypothetical protein FB45DRAFT_870873 [Roridomyces roridus]